MSARGTDQTATPAWPEFLGLRVARFDMQQAVAAIACAARGDEWRYVVTPNAAHWARLARADAALAAIYRQADFCFLDSRVIALAARAAGLRPPPVVTGADLTAELFRTVIHPSSRLCVVGGSADSLARLAAAHGLERISHLNPSFGFWQDAREMKQVVAFIVASQADFTFLCVGSPQQEQLAALVAARGGARGVGICAGAAIDFLTGGQRRAPRFVQRMALEWLYRLCREPRRLSYRYLVESPRGVLLVLRHASQR